MTDPCKSKVNSHMSYKCSYYDVRKVRESRGEIYVSDLREELTLTQMIRQNGSFYLDLELDFGGNGRVARTNGTRDDLINYVVTAL